MHQRHQRFGIAVLYNVLLFSLLFAFSTPIFNSGDDAFCLYLLGGGFNTAPTELVHFNHALHPFLTIPIKHLFIINPNVNWYSWLLISSHFLAYTIILFFIVSKKSIKNGLLIYSLIFWVFECPFLLAPTFTNTSIALTCAALVVLVSTVLETSFCRNRYVIAIFLLGFASLFRIHSIIPFVGIALPFLFSPFGMKNLIRVCGCLTLSLLLIVILNQIHQSYYKQHVPNWTKQEQYRQHLYRIFNFHSLHEVPTQKWKTEQELIKYALTIDTVYLSSEKLSKMQKDLLQDRDIIASTFSIGPLKWFIINNRILFTTVFLFGYLYAFKKKYILTCLFSFALMVGGMGCLLFYLKLQAYIILGCLSLFSTLVYFSSPPRNNNHNIIKLAGASFLLFWALVRIYKTNVQSKIKNSLFISATNEIIKVPEKLFLVSDNSFPLDYISIFDTPKKYPLKNIILADHHFTGLDNLILHQFNIKSVRDIPHSDNILLWGKPVPALVEYYLKTTGERISFSPPLENFKYGEVRRIEVLK